MRIYGLQQSNKDLKEALRLSGEIVANNEKAVENYKEIIKDNKKKGRNRLFYFTGAGAVVGFVVGLLVR